METGELKAIDEVVGEYNGIKIRLDKMTKKFYTMGYSKSGYLESYTYSGLQTMVDDILFPKNETNELVTGFKNYSNVNFTNCNFITPEGYDKLSDEDKTLIENLIKSLNEKK